MRDRVGRLGANRVGQEFRRDVEPVSTQLENPEIAQCLAVVRVLTQGFVEGRNRASGITFVIVA